MSIQNTSSHQENKIFLSCSYTSREEFVREYRKFYSGKAEAKELYLLLLTELKSVVSVGNIDRFKHLSSLIGCICSVENQATLRTYYNDTNNPIKNTNLVIQAAKHNKVEILKCLFENIEILNNLSIDIGKESIAPSDKDGTCHNAFYYAMRSGNVELLDTLINKWPDDYFTAHSEELENVLSRSYEELKLKNVPLTDDIEIFVENKLISLRFFSNNSKQVYNVKDDINSIKERIGLLLENISLLKKEYLNTKNVDERFLFITKFIAQNIHILKRQLKSTCDRLPWEEIEFCLVCFVSSCIKQQEINLFYHTVLNKDKILNHLDIFASKIEELKVIDNIDISRFLLPDLPREKVVAEIISNKPQFEALYNDYRQIRDAYSLEKISSYIELALSADSESKEGQLVITRSMQVIGEYLKNSLESPNLSSTTSDILFLSLSKNTREIICDLRDSLSHAYSLFKRTEMQERTDVNYFANIQNDIKNVGIVIDDILRNKKLNVVKELLEKILDSKDQDEIRETADILNNIQICDMIIKTGISSREEEKVEELIKELKIKMNEKTNYEKKLFNEVDDIINSKKSSVIRFKRDYIPESMAFLFGNKIIDSDVIKTIRTFAGDILCNIPKVGSKNLNEITKFVTQLYSSDNLKVQDKEISKILCKIFCIAEFNTSKIKWIEELKSNLDIDTDKNNKNIQGKKLKDGHNYKKILDQRLFTLNDILNKNGLSDQLVENFSFYKKERKLQSAVEMLVLDILSILSSPENYDLENNQLFLDYYSPLLIGICLHNYLAHGNALIDILLSDPSIAVILNTEKLTTENITEKKLGKLVRDDPSKLKDRYTHGLATITNQERMFITIEEGNLEGLKSCLKEGADINARRHTNLWTALHFAAKGSNLEVVKFILNHTHNLKIDSKDIHNQNPLHIVAAFGSSEIAKYFVEDKGMNVNCLDKHKRSPTLIAAKNGHKNVLDILLKNNADINVKDLNGFTSLHYAVKNNHRDIVMILLEREKNVDINKTNGGLTPLHIASINNNLELVNFLLENKANVNAICYSGWTPLHYIAWSGNKTIAYALIKKGADINAKSTGQGYTPLHIAAKYGNTEIVKVLLNNDAAINIKSIQNHETPLHLASEGGYKDIVKTLLHEGADANARDNDNCTPLHFAALGSDNKEIVEALICEGANTNAESKQGDTPLHFATTGGYKGVVEVLVKTLIDIDIKNDENKTPIELAVLHGHLQIVKTLLQHKRAYLNAKGFNDFTVLHFAAHVGNFEIVKFLINKGVDITAKTSQGDTSLHLAARGGHKEVSEILLHNGSDVNSKSGKGFTPLHYAAERGYKKIVEVLIEKGANVDSKDHKNNFTPLYLSAQNGNLDIVKMLLDKEANVNAKSSNNITPLHAAALIGDKRIAETLIKSGANFDAVDRNNSTALHIAASEGHNDVVEVLLNESNVNVKNSKDGTPIELAVLSGHLQVVQTLLHDKRVNINAKDINGCTVLHIASQLGKLEIVKYLIGKGANVNAQNIDGNTPLHIAMGNRYKNIIEFLRVNGADISIKNNNNMSVEELEIAVAWSNLYQSDSSQKTNKTNNHDLKAKELFKQLLSIREWYYGRNHIKVAEILMNLGKIEINLGNNQKAKILLERALRIHEKHGSENSEVAETLVYLASTYEKLDNSQEQEETCGLDFYKEMEKLGNFKQQKELLEQALSIKEKTYGVDHFEVAAILVNLSVAYGNLGNAGKRKNLLERALPILKKHYGSDHFEIAIVLINLGNTYGDLGDFQKQKKFLEEGLKIQKSFSSDHFSIGITLDILGGMCLNLGDILGAKQLLEQALKIKEKHYGSNNVEFASTLVSLSTVHKILGNNQKAKHMLEQVLKIEELHCGSNKLKLASTLLNLGTVYGNLGNSTKNKELCEKALSIAEGYYDRGNFELAKLLANLGIAYGDLGNNQKAKELLEEAVAIQERHIPNNFEVAATLVNLAATYNKLGKHQEEKKLLEQALEIQEKHGSDHSGVVRTLMKLSKANRHLNFLQKEKKLIERALEIQEKHGKDNTMVVEILGNLSISCVNLGDLKKGKELLERALKIQEEHYGHDSFEVVRILENLSVTYKKLGNNQKAKMLMERALKLKKKYGIDCVEVATTRASLSMGNAYGALGGPKSKKK